MKFKLKNTIFENDKFPICNLCSSDLNFKILNIKSELHNSILGCKNENCISNTTKLKRKEIWKAFLPEGEYQKIHNKVYNIMISNNRLRVEFWTKKGLREEEAKQKIFEIQSDNSKKVKNRFIVSKENLINSGFSDEEIKDICQTPSMTSFWIKKGMTKEEAKQMVSKHQSNSAKMVNFESRLLPSNIEYWIIRGYTEEESKLRVSESQKTFTKQKCIEKYGLEDGYNIWKNRQEKWQKSLYKNGNIKGGYSKVSQELFDALSKHCNNVKYATNNSELVIRNNKKNYYYDFVDVDRKKIIEYNGDQYHANPLKYESNSYPHPYRKKYGYTAKDIWKYDLDKKNAAVDIGYDYLVIWDSEYKQNREEVIKKCIDFLTK